MEGRKEEGAGRREKGIEIEQRKMRDPQAQPPRVETVPGERKLRRSGETEKRNGKKARREVRENETNVKREEKKEGEL